MPYGWLKAFEDVKSIDKATKVTRSLPNIGKFYEEVVAVQTRWRFAPTPKSNGDLIKCNFFQNSNEMIRFEYLSGMSEDTRAQRERIDRYLKK
jgi:hypothetical protein